MNEEIINIVNIAIQRNGGRAKIVLTDVFSQKYILTSSDEIGNELALNIVEI
jgi:hypothetical protein